MCARPSLPEPSSTALMANLAAFRPKIHTSHNQRLFSGCNLISPVLIFFLSRIFFAFSCPPSGAIDDWSGADWRTRGEGIFPGFDPAKQVHELYLYLSIPKLINSLVQRDLRGRWLFSYCWMLPESRCAHVMCGILGPLIMGFNSSGKWCPACPDVLEARPPPIRVRIICSKPVFSA